MSEGGRVMEWEDPEEGVPYDQLGPSRDGMAPLPLDHELPPLASHRYKLERGWKKRWLLHKLARSEGSHQTLADNLGCTARAVGQFAQRHQIELAEIRAQLEEEMVGLWVASKTNRLAEYQQDIEDLMDALQRALTPPDPDPLNPGETERPPGSEEWLAMIKTKEAALRQVAEELGQIPNRVRMDVTGAVVTYRIEGVDLDKL